MRTLALLAIALGVGSIAVYMTTLSVPPPPAPAHPIVGKWEEVVLSGRPVTPGMGMIAEYKPDGVVVFNTMDRQGCWSQESGHYVVNGNTIQFSIPSRTLAHMGPPEFTVNFALLGRNRYAVPSEVHESRVELVRVAD